MVVGNNHTADGSAAESKIPKRRMEFKMVCMQRALEKVVAFAPAQGYAVMVVGDWNMTYEVVQQALRGMNGGEWEVSDEDAQRDFLVANRGVKKVELNSALIAWDKQHQVHSAWLPLPVRRRGAAEPPVSELSALAKTVVEWLRKRKAKEQQAALEERMMKEYELEKEASELQQREEEVRAELQALGREDQQAAASVQQDHCVQQAALQQRRRNLEKLEQELKQHGEMVNHWRNQAKARAARAGWKAREAASLAAKKADAENESRLKAEKAQRAQALLRKQREEEERLKAAAAARTEEALCRQQEDERLKANTVACVEKARRQQEEAARRRQQEEEADRRHKAAMQEAKELHKATKRRNEAAMQAAASALKAAEEATALHDAAKQEAAQARAAWEKHRQLRTLSLSSLCVSAGETS